MRREAPGARHMARWRAWRRRMLLSGACGEALRGGAMPQRDMRERAERREAGAREESAKSPPPEAGEAGSGAVARLSLQRGEVER